MDTDIASKFKKMGARVVMTRFPDFMLIRQRLGNRP